MSGPDLQPHDGPSFYDDAEVFRTYAAHRASIDSANDTLERPLIRELLGDVAGLAVLDLGCGDAAIGCELLASGAAAYLGIDGSSNMIAAARRTLATGAGHAEQSAIEAWPYPAEQFDRVVARLSLHYVADLDAVCAAVFRTLRRGGRFVFSVEHPVITASCRRAADGQSDGGWIVDDYFAAGRRETRWMGGQVVKYHRTVQDHFAALHGAGFVVDALRESQPQRSRFADPSAFERWRRVPLFLFMSGLKLRGHEA